MARTLTDLVRLFTQRADAAQRVVETARLDSTCDRSKGRRDAYRIAAKLLQGFLDANGDGARRPFVAIAAPTTWEGEKMRMLNTIGTLTDELEAHRNTMAMARACVGVADGKDFIVALRRALGEAI